MAGLRQSPKKTGRSGAEHAAGYSGTPLVKKLGLKPGMILYVHQPPASYFDWLFPWPENAVVKARPAGKLDFIHLFVQQEKTFRKEFIRVKKYLKPDGMVWVSWPKKASKVETDLDENVIRRIGLAEGLVDVKVCAVDNVWSGLKFVIRVADR